MTKTAYTVLGALMLAFGLFATYDLVSNSGFNRLETPLLGFWGVFGPDIAMVGLVFARFHGRRWQNKALAGIAISASALQTTGLIPFVQPRLLAPTPGHAGVGINEILTVLMILGGIVGAIVGVVTVLVAQPAE